MLTSYVQENKINETDNKSDSQAVAIRLMTGRILLSIN